VQQQLQGCSDNECGDPVPSFDITLGHVVSSQPITLSAQKFEVRMEQNLTGAAI